MNVKNHLRRITDLSKEIEAERKAIRGAVKTEIEAGTPVSEFVEMTNDDVAIEQGITAALMRTFPYLSHVTFDDRNMTLFLREGDKWLHREENIASMPQFLAQILAEAGQTDRHMTVVINKKPKTKREPVVELIRFEIVTGELLAASDVIMAYPEFFTSLDEVLRSR